MSRDVLIRGGVVSFIERGLKDVTYLPLSDPPDVSFISEADWKALIGNQSEAAYIASMGWTVDG